MSDDGMTDEEIYAEAQKEWLGVLMRLWDAFGIVPDDKTVEAYYSALGDIPLGLLERSVIRAIRNHRFNSAPTIAEVLAAVRAELGEGAPRDFGLALEMWTERHFASIARREPYKTRAF